MGRTTSLPPLPCGWRVSRRVVMSVVLLAGATWQAGLAQRADTILLVRKEAWNSVIAYDTSGERRHVLYSRGTYIPSVGVSADGEYIAFREKVHRDFFAPYRLVVIDPSGRVLRVVDKNVQRFTWCCGAGKMAVITGQTAESHPGFLPDRDGVFVVDVLTGSEIALPDIPFPYQLHWAAFDSSLYIRTSTTPDDPTLVYRYQPATGELSRTSRRGIFFSPDGQYYFEDLVAGSFGLYRSSDDADVTSRLPPHVRGVLNPQWAPDADHVLLLPDLYRPPVAERRPLPEEPTERMREAEETLRQKLFVVDAASGRLIRTLDTDFAHWSTNAMAIPVREGRRVRLIRVPRP